MWIGVVVFISGGGGDVGSSWSLATRMRDNAAARNNLANCLLYSSKVNTVISVSFYTCRETRWYVLGLEDLVGIPSTWKAFVKIFLFSKGRGICEHSLWSHSYWAQLVVCICWAMLEYMLVWLYGLSWFKWFKGPCYMRLSSDQICFLALFISGHHSS